jgi:AcrR family transcriptional regulator
MTRPSDITRERILKAAERLFAEHGYEETSIRAIVAKARVNQAAINYHFGGKDGLYREVLRTAFRALTKQQLAHAQEMKGMSRENALSEFIRHQLHSLGERGELSRHLRIFNWEAVRPTAVYRKLMSEEAAPFMALAVDLVRRFLPKADQSTLIMAAIWLVGQCAIFVRNREQLAPRFAYFGQSSYRAAHKARQRLGARRPGICGMKVGVPSSSTPAYLSKLSGKSPKRGGARLGPPRQGRLRLDLSNDLPRLEKNSQQCRPRRPIGSSTASVSQTPHC